MLTSRRSVGNDALHFTPFETVGLVCDADPVGRAVEGTRERSLRLRGRIVLSRQVRGDDVPQPRCIERGQQLSRRLVVQMPETARYALFQRKRIVAVGEHVEVVV